ncbi:hypothetical protein BGZ76_008556 [Entomortierella beljakovae]|nr:hypothetical protein BGZ76_008556 [Entomortierella beljakovae]
MDLKIAKYKSTRIQARLEVDVTSPRYISMDPPQYGTTVQSIDMLLGAPADFVDEPPRYDITT